MDLSEFDAVVFDLDGTVYYGPNLIDGSKDVISFFRSNNKLVFFGTNNSSKTRQQITEKLNLLGIDCTAEEVITSGFLAYNLVKKLNLDNVYVCGSENLIKKFSDGGVKINQTEDALNLVIGYDIMFTYEELTTAVRVAINSKTIISCNEERNYPGENNRIFPSCGGIVKAIEWCANKKSDYVVGKPNAYLIDYITENYKIDSSRILVIGDSFEFDASAKTTTYNTRTID